MHNTLVLVMSALFVVTTLSFPAVLLIKRIKPVRMKFNAKERGRHVGDLPM